MCNDNNGKDPCKLHDCRHGGCRRGPSSFFKHDTSLVFEKLALRSGESFLDLGCGAGDYSVHAAQIVGDSGRVYALDLNAEFLDTVRSNAQKLGVRNLYSVVSDIRRRIDLPDGTADVCLIATVLHTIRFPEGKAKLFSEVRRVLKPDGRLAVIECKKEDALHGPPLHMRISPEELENELSKHGFSKTGYYDLGTNYMATFVCNR